MSQSNGGASNIARPLANPPNVMSRSPACNAISRVNSGNTVLRVGGYDGKIAGLYDLDETLGSGHFAVVKSARHVFTGERVAVKVIDKSKLDEVSKGHLFQEVRCMKLVQHPNVVKLYEVIDTHTKLYLILELGDGGDLYDYIMRHESGLSESVARNYFRQIVRAISYCHSLHVVHRDLKPENVVFFEKLGVVKLTDFGFSNKFCPGQKLETSCGSLAYSAPEILLGDSYDAPAVDVWSLGVILYMLVCGHPPFHEANDSETLTMIMDCKYSIPDHVSSACKRLIGQMLVRSPEARATLAEVASDPWISAGHAGGGAAEAALAARATLTPAEKSSIMQKMVTGGIATEPKILDSLAKGDYNHITATFYLLAEKKLRARRSNDDDWSSGVPDSLTVNRNPNLLAPPLPRTPNELPPRSRKCSIVREEEDEESSNDGRRPSRSDTRLAARLHQVNLQQEPAPPQLEPPPPPVPPPARSCSSSDLSDSDSDATRRRRPTAACEPPPPTQRRRDSDSSDSQERGSGMGGPSATTSAEVVVSRVTTYTHTQTHNQSQGGGGGDTRGSQSRRRRRECRLRESRSLNRIAEVDEPSARAALAALCRRPLLRLLRPHARLQRSLC